VHECRSGRAGGSRCRGDGRRQFDGQYDRAPHYWWGCKLGDCCFNPLARNGLSLSLSLTDRIIDPVKKIVDLAIRFGETKDTCGLITSKLTEQRSLIVASPAYIRQQGAPTTIDDIENHDCIVGVRRDIPTSWRVKADDGSIFRVTPPATHEIGDGAAIVDAAVAGLGLAQMPSSLPDDLVKAGRLTAVLEEVTGTEIESSAVCPATRHSLPRIRYVVDALVEEGQRGNLGT
jgi:DNA-binding transcriptional LysR family regulator